MKPGPKPITHKVCPACGILKERSEYYKKGSTISHKCKPCSLIDLRSRAHLYSNKYAERVNSWKRKQTALDTEYNQRRKLLKKLRYEIMKDELNARRRDRYATDMNCPARKDSYWHRVKERTPKWANLKEISDFYANRPDGFHVDHVIPLRGLIDGRPVSGLNVIWNLQYLSALENQKKHCRITEDYLATLRVKR